MSDQFLVTGERRPYSCAAMRIGPICGPSALLFEPKE
jgi:hypothetical protein